MNFVGDPQHEQCPIDADTSAYYGRTGYQSRPGTYSTVRGPVDFALSDDQQAMVPSVLHSETIRTSDNAESPAKIIFLGSGPFGQQQNRPAT
jgi:hypothetical protein